MDADTRKLCALMERAVAALERIAGIEAPVDLPKPPPLTEEAQLKDRVTLVRRRGEPVPEWTGGIPPAGASL
jgi:hypothetical protein